jgi:hypothetical protein
MPLRDHFRPPLDDMRHWQGCLAGWPVMMVALLHRKLPRRFFAEPRIHSASSGDIDAVTIMNVGDDGLPSDERNGGQTGTTPWSPPQPTLTVATDLPAHDAYEVLVYDEKRQGRLVAAVEIVSPANKGRPEHRRVFVARCANLLRERVAVVIVDVVTTRAQNLYAKLLDEIGLSDPGLSPEPPPLSAVACRLTKRGNDWHLQSWTYPLGLGKPLPTLPLWLADDLAVPLELEESYEQSCGILNIP